MGAHILVDDHESVHFDYESAASVIASFTVAAGNLNRRAIAQGGSVAWSTLTVDVEVSTVSDHRLTEEFDRVRAGRSTLSLSTSVVFDGADL